MTTRTGSGGFAKSALVGLAWLACGAWTGQAHNASAGPHLQVRGTSHFDAKAQVQSAGASARALGAVIAISGTLLDDADHVVGHAPLGVTFVTEDGTRLDARSCTPDNAPLAPVLHGERGTWTVTTDTDGTFCVRAAARPGTTKATLAWAGTSLLSGSETELTVDPARSIVMLAFDPEPRIVGLAEGARVIDVVATIAAGAPFVGASARAGGLTLSLSDERDAPLASAVTDVEGHARFVVPEKALGEPGPGELRLVFKGDATHLAARKTMACERRVMVVVSEHGVAETNGAGVASDLASHAEDADDESSVDLDVTTAAGQLVPSGSVEGLVEGAVVGIAPVSLGRSHLVVRMPVATGASAGAAMLVAARYVPEVPWYVAGAPKTVPVTARAGTAWKRAAVLVAGLFTLAWFFLSRSRVLVRARRPEAETDEGAAREPTARIELIAAPDHERTGWSGRVVDAHDGEPVRGASLSLERPSFGSVEIVARATADDDGRFVLDARASRAGDHLTAHGPLHGSVVRDAPPMGELQVSLVSRRRTVLRKLIDWAKRRGAPFEATPEPTPAYIRRMAGEDARTVRWAGAVEQAAFGQGAVDRAVETEIDRLGHEVEAAAGPPRP